MVKNKAEIINQVQIEIFNTRGLGYTAKEAIVPILEKILPEYNPTINLEASKEITIEQIKEMVRIFVDECLGEKMFILKEHKEK